MGGFLYGAATSAHQVEGGNVLNDWWEWEKNTPGIEQSGKAADHWNRYKEDIALAKTLGHNAHRFSIEWSRIEPEPGVFSRAAVEHYRSVLKEIRRHNMKSFMTLHHFTNPLWFSRNGGWTTGNAPEAFERYVQYIVQHLSEEVDFWVTVNEPMVYASQSFWRKRWPPQEHNLRRYVRVVHNLARAHTRAYRIIHRFAKNAHVGIAKHFIANKPFVSNWWFNHRFFQLTPRTHDFIGVNYYFPNEWEKFKGEKSDLGWPIYPEGLTQALLAYTRYRKPMYVTENGIADAQDSRRAEFIRSHLRAVEVAQQQGADVRGYLHWSLLDNFEWADGFAPRFGLIEVDYKTLERKIRPSAYVYKAIIEQANIISP